MTLYDDSKASGIQGVSFTQNADENSRKDEMECPASFWKSLEQATFSFRQFLPVNQDGPGTGPSSYSAQAPQGDGELAYDAQSCSV